MPPRPAPTHFLCIPLVGPVSRPQLTQSLSTFQDDVTSPASFAVPEGAVRPVGTLHLTLGVLSFPRDAGLERARELLRSLKTSTLLSSLPARITLRGLASMQPAAKAAVLYASPADETGELQTFCEKVRGAFLEAGLMMDENRPLLLHATLLNTIYVKKSKQGKQGKRSGERLTIDARAILDRYEDQVWIQDVPVDRVAICKMGAKAVDVDGVTEIAYEVVEEIKI